MDAIFNDKGEQIPDNTPIEMPLGYNPPEDLNAMIKRLVMDATIQAAAANAGLETFDEADDLDIMDEEDIVSSKHEFTQMQEENLLYDKAQSKAPVNRDTKKERQSKATADTGEEPETTDEKPVAKPKKKSAESALAQ